MSMRGLNGFYRISALFAVFLFLFSCAKSGEDFIKKGRSFLDKGLISDARLAFGEGLEFYQKNDGPNGVLECRVWLEIAGLRSGRYSGETGNLLRILLEIGAAEKKGPYLFMLAASALTRAYIYSLEYEKAGETLISLKQTVKELTLLEDKKVNNKLRKKLAPLCLELKTYLAILDLSGAVQSDNELFLFLKAGAEYDSSLIELSEACDKLQSPNLTADDFASFPDEANDNLALRWLSVVNLLHNETQTPIDKAAYIREAKDFFAEKGLYCLKGYAAYYLAGFAELFDGGEAIENYKQAFPIMEDLGKQDYYVNCLSALAVLYYKKGNYLPAADYFNNVLPLYEENSDKTNIAECRNYLATINKALGNLSLAEKEFLEVLEMYRDLGNRKREASILNNIGIIYKDQLQYDKALDYFTQAIKIADELIAVETDIDNLRELRYEKLIKVNNLAEISISMGEYLKAINGYLKQLSEDIISYELENTLLDATVRMNLASCRYFLVREDPGLTLDACRPILAGLEKADEIFEALGESVKTGETKYLRGQIYFNAGHYGEAEKIYLELKDFYTQSKNVSHLAGLSYSLFLASDELGKISEATDSLRQSVASYDEYIRLIPGTEGRNKIFEKYLPYFRTLIERLIEAGEIEEAYKYSEMMKARVLLSQMRSRELDPMLDVPTDLKNKLKELSANESVLIKEFERNYRWAYYSGDFGYLDLIKSRLASIEQERNAVYHSIRVINSRLADINELNYADFDKVSTALGPDRLALNYLFLEDGLCVFLIDENSIKVRKLGGPGFDRAALMRRLLDFRENLQEYRLDPAPQAEYFFDLLMAPILDECRSYGKLVIIPDEELFYIPFDALRDAGSGKYFIDLYDGAVSYSVSGALFVDLEQKPDYDFAMEYYGLGDPAYGGRASQLRFTGEELDESSALFGGLARLYKGGQATETRVKTADLSPYRYLHFSCHGMNYGNSAFLSFPALLLATDGAADPNDGFLRHDEISSLKLNAEMVLLSACQTGLGKIVPGDGLVGLNQAFFIAGAKSVVSSLWSVSDRYTMLLITDFFNRIKNGADSDLALRQAAKAIKARELREYGNDHPFFWAPFVLTGKVF